MTDDERHIELAWAGWRMRVPADWRPLGIRGGWRRGGMIVGDGRQAVLQVQWWRPGRAAFDGARWAAARVRRLAGRRGRHGPAETPPGFAAAALAEAPGPGGQERELCCLYAAAAGLALEMAAAGAGGTMAGRPSLRRLLGFLRAAGPDEPTRWAVFDASFGIPAGLLYRSARLLVGDMALCFAASRRRLVVRQVYPAELALSRRELVGWLADRRFGPRRLFRRLGPPEPWTVRRGGRELGGLLLRGRKLLPAPLGRLRPLWSVAAGVEDRELGRLLLAEYDDPEELRPDAAADAVAAMGRARTGPGKAQEG